jgi:hypothetical protein
LPGLPLNCDPPDLCLLSSQDYWQEPLVHWAVFLGLEYKVSTNVFSWEAQISVGETDTI